MLLFWTRSPSCPSGVVLRARIVLAASSGESNTAIAARLETTRQAIRRGTFRSVHELTAAMRRFIDAYTDRARPFVWAKTADQILAHAKRDS